MTDGNEAYLDIETTGLSPWHNEITVIGMHVCGGGGTAFTQLVGPGISVEGLLQALRGVDTIYTYNGSRFDLPFINHHLGVDLAGLFRHCDLMYECWRNNIHGGFKAAERYLGIERQLKGVDGLEAIRLWWRYVNDYDEAALSTLLQYNKEDVINLKTLKQMLL